MSVAFKWFRTIRAQQVTGFITPSYHRTAGDPLHGPAPYDVMERRMKILNAYYSPDSSDSLYPTITPVNSFRLIFNQYFRQDYPMLDDRSLFSEYDIRYNYIEVPNTCQP